MVWLQSNGHTGMTLSRRSHMSSSLRQSSFPPNMTSPGPPCVLPRLELGAGRKAAAVRYLWVHDSMRFQHIARHKAEWPWDFTACRRTTNVFALHLITAIYTTSRTQTEHERCPHVADETRRTPGLPRIITAEIALPSTSIKPTNLPFGGCWFSSLSFTPTAIQRCETGSNAHTSVCSPTPVIRNIPPIDNIPHGDSIAVEP